MGKLHVHQCSEEMIQSISSEVLGWCFEKWQDWSSDFYVNAKQADAVAEGAWQVQCDVDDTIGFGPLMSFK